MSREQFIERFFPLNTEEDKLYGWYLTKTFAWRVFEIDFRIDAGRPGLELKAITYGRDTITFYDSAVGMGRDIYIKPLIVTNNYTRAVLDDIINNNNNKTSDDAKQTPYAFNRSCFSYDGKSAYNDKLVLVPNDKLMPSERDFDGHSSFESGLELKVHYPSSYLEDTKYIDHLQQVLYMHDLYYTKNQDYGDAFTDSIDEFGPVAAVVRMSDKWSRLKNLIENDFKMVLDESVDDTLIDLANYAIMTALHLRGKKKDD